MISTIRRFRPAALCAGVLATLLLAGCATEETASTDEPEVADAVAALEPMTEMPMPRAFFTNLENGQTVPLEFEVVFGVENFNIVAVEDPMMVRDGEGHYHLAVDVDCITSGEIIPPGTASYIHFGTGADRITMNFEPGEHRLCLQVADGEHRVLVGDEYAGLTQEIAVTAAEQ